MKVQVVTLLEVESFVYGPPNWWASWVAERGLTFHKFSALAAGCRKAKVYKKKNQTQETVNDVKPKQKKFVEILIVVRSQNTDQFLKMKKK